VPRMLIVPRTLADRRCLRPLRPPFRDPRPEWTAPGPQEDVLATDEVGHPGASCEQSGRSSEQKGAGSFKFFVPGGPVIKRLWLPLR